MTETALLALSGKILDRPFDPDAIDALRSAIEKNLSDRGVVVVRRVATLCDERLKAAPYFLKAGFETIPADDEDIQIATTICAAVMARNPPDEIVFMTGIEEPVNLLRAIAGRSRRVLLRLGDSKEDVALSDALGFSLEGVLDVRELLSKDGVNWNRLNRRVWDERSPLLSAESEEQDASVEVVSVVDAAESGSVDEPRARVEAALESEIETSEEIREVAETRETEETAELEERVDEPLTDDVDSLIRSSDAYSEIVDAAPQWNAELEKIVRENGLKSSAFLTTELLDCHFPGLHQFYLFEREKFRKILSDRLRLVVDDEGAAFFYHVEHPEMRPPESGVAARLTLGTSLEETKRERSGTSLFEDNAKSVEPCSARSRFSGEPTTFARLVKVADLMRRQCESSADRFSIIPDTLYAKEHQLNGEALRDEAKELGVYLWQLHCGGLLDENGFREMSERYDLFGKAFSLLEKVDARRKSFSDRLVVRVLQNAVSAQCLLKSAFVSSRISLGRDPMIGKAAELILDYRREHYPSDSFKHLKRDDFLDTSSRPAILREHDALSREYDERLAFLKGHDDCAEKFKRVAGLISGSPDRSDSDAWKIVVETATDLCERYNEPFSSLLFRTSLLEIVDDLPEDVETTPSFDRVVREVRRCKTLGKDDFSNDFDFDLSEKNVSSPEILAIRERFAGSKVVFVGDVPNVNAREKIENAFDVELVWFKTYPDSLAVFNSSLRDPKVKLFLVYLPDREPRYSEELAGLVENAGKDFIRLPQGLNHKHIARVICERLKLSGTPRGGS